MKYHGHMVWLKDKTWLPPSYSLETARFWIDRIILFTEIAGFHPNTTMVKNNLRKKLVCMNTLCFKEAIWWDPFNTYHYCDQHIEQQTDRNSVFFVWTVIKYLNFLYEKNLLEKMIRK